MKERIIKIRLITLIISLISVIGVMTVSINAEINKIDEKSPAFCYNK